MRHLLALALLLAATACDRKEAPAPSGSSATETLDHPVFDEAFAPGFTITQNGTTFAFRTEDVGRVDLPTGRLAAFDPFVEFEAEPFEKELPRGSFPLRLAIARSGDDERIALAKIAFSDARIARWELALVEGQDPATLKPGEFFGYGVDSGTGSFMDEAAMHAYAGRLRREGEEFSDHLIEAMEKTYVHTRSWLLLPTERGTVALFSSGYGDGAYATYFAYDAQQNLVAAITDFGVIAWR
ncbi:DUF4241 domain-containing protein [Dokdonella sp.]|uniref:DUF4241 domain-containing protein n=1 Tax=Dokdonella sp. TaxID=2291710 RepID=UPI001B1B103E|nr:DUF4241 domain-containing protein [Dokdonella sp.]MBO9662292.1 DUF4241 domain-containing protein [Dokdonella sp.]